MEKTENIRKTALRNKNGCTKNGKINGKVTGNLNINRNWNNNIIKNGKNRWIEKK